MMRFLRFIFLLLSISPVFADTIDRYMNIVDNIPKMEMKADPDAQVWVRSARNVINLTCESIAETLTLTNNTASQRHSPLFCLPGNTSIDAPFLNQLIQQTYRNISSPTDVKDRMTVSEVALLGLMQKFPCTAQGMPIAVTAPSNSLMSSSEMMHVGAIDQAEGFRPL